MKIFYDTIRPHFPGGKLTANQVAGLERIIEAFAKYGNRNVNALAKILATAKWETGHQMQPVKETQRGAVVPSDATVIKRLDTAFAKGQLGSVKKPYWKGGYFGRGDVQLTHKFNYEGKAREAVLAEFGVDIGKDPGLVLRPDISAFILVKGMIEGWFSGQSIMKWIDEHDESDAEDIKEYMAARAAVNGKDKAREIAESALVFEAAIRKAQTTGDMAPETPVEAPEPPTMPEVQPTPSTAPTDEYRTPWGIISALLALAIIGAVLAWWVIFR